MDGEENDEPAAWVINDGAIDVSGEINGMLINLEDGTCNLMHGTLGQGGVVSLGTFTHTVFKTSVPSAIVSAGKRRNAEM